MRPYKDYVQKRRLDNHEEDVFTGILVMMAFGALFGIMLGVSI